MVKCLVTGANGYIALHIIDQLLKQGHSVRGTIRNLNDKEKVEAVKRLGDVELVQADLLDEEGLRNAVKRVDVVFHVATALPVNLTDNIEDDDLIKPTLAGTLTILNAALEENVKKVILTSSAITVHNIISENRTYSEKDWIDVSTVQKSMISAYQKSKIISEKAAWNFYEKHKMNGKCFDFATVLPSFTLGPLLNQTHRSSISLFLALFNQQLEKVDGFNFPVCDVRDVALAHLKAAELDEAVGHRFLIVSKPNFVPTKEIADILKKAGYKINNVVQPITSDAKIDDYNLRNILKIQPIDFEKTILDTAESLVQNGLISR